VEKLFAHRLIMKRLQVNLNKKLTILIETNQIIIFIICAIVVILKIL
jgi:hypothetical protein